MTAAAVDAAARALVALLGTGRQCPPLSHAHPDLDEAQAAVIAGAVRELRRARGEVPVGRKTGFTNTTIWPIYGVSGPIWNHVFDTTLHDPMPEAIALDGFAEPRIEPEIAFGLARAPDATMDESALAGCIAWIAHSFEIVQSVYPGWRFTAPEATAAFGLHGALLLGPKRPVETLGDDWVARLADFTLTLRRDGQEVATGHASAVLGGPLQALRHLVAVLAAEAGAPPLAAGEVVTTGTLADAYPLAPGEVWSTEIAGMPIAGLRLRIR